MRNCDILSDEKNNLSGGDGASRALANINSASMTRWKKYLSSKLDAPLSFRIDTQVDFKEAQRRFAQRYLQFQVARHEDRASLVEALGLSSSHTYRLLDEYGIEGPGPRRKA